MASKWDRLKAQMDATEKLWRTEGLTTEGLDEPVGEPLKGAPTWRGTDPMPRLEAAVKKATGR